MAAEIPGEIRGRLEALAAGLRGAPLPVRWARGEGVHLTFKFLGETGPDREGPIAAAVAAAARGAAPFDLEAAGLGTFPERGAPRVVWAGVRGDLAAMERLHRALEEGLAPLGFALEGRVFRPHLTLGRVKGPGRGEWRSMFEAHAADRFGSFRVKECVLFESRLEPGGAIYQARGRFPLSGAPPG